MSQTLIALGTAAVAGVVPIEIKTGKLPSTLIAVGLAGAEEVPVKVSVDNGVTWQNLYMEGAQVKLTATSNSLGIFSPLLLGVTKPLTVGSAGVFLSTNENP